MSSSSSSAAAAAAAGAGLESAPSFADVKDDPAFRLVQEFHARDRMGGVRAAKQSDEAAQAAQAAQAAMSAQDKAVRESLKRRKVEVEAKKLMYDEAAIEQKARAEQMKTFARATKDAAAARAAEQSAAADTPEARYEALRQLNLMRDMLDVPGTGKRCTVETPLKMLLTELDVMHNQANLRRASNAPVEFFHYAVRLGERGAASLGYDAVGAADDLEALYEASKAAENPAERHYYEAMVQMSIKYGSWFATGPEKFVALTAGRVILNRIKYNQVRSAMAAGQNADADSISAAFAAMGLGDDGVPVRQPAAAAAAAAADDDSESSSAPRRSGRRRAPASKNKA